ncbi:nucleotidyltransferase family protein [Roseateles sp. NT4]|uniref:nucleotidyltransferase family protein n=1 Tax=Roseateles sp. NT4 TaxID=3453715 RepID=UPI003EED5679
MKEMNELPDAKVLQATLRVTTDRLAAELASPLAVAPAWSAFEWRAAMAIAVMHGISGLLAGRLLWQGPSDWQAFLADQLAHSRQRECKVRDLLARLDAAAREAGIPLVALKGSALLDLGLYAAGERPMSDIDLLMRKADFEIAHAIVMRQGFSEGITSWKHRDYLPLNTPARRGFGEHADNPIKIELHTALPERLPVREIDVATQVMAPDASAGLNAYASPAALMRHLLLHAAGNLCEYTIRLVHLNDIAALAPRLSESDWSDALVPASDGLPAWWAVPPFSLAQRLFPARIRSTPRAMQRAMSACPRWLRAAAARYDLHGASVSRLGISMLPGLEWSHTLAEAGRFAIRRLHPRRDEQATTRLQVQSVHALASSPWTHRPSWLKTLSFLFGTPPRAQTMYSLHQALGYRPNSPA